MIISYDIMLKDRFYASGKHDFSMQSFMLSIESFMIKILQKYPSLKSRRKDITIYLNDEYHTEICYK